MKALVLDFDGVISDSAPEAFQVALETYRDLGPETALSGQDRDALYAAFVEMMPLGNRAEDFGVELRALEAGRALPDQAAYDAFKAAQPADWLRAFHRRFYKVRDAWARRDPAGWQAGMRPYADFVALLRARAGDAELAIATAKDRRSVRRLLEIYGIDDLFAEDRVLDKEAGVSKAAHLEQLRERLDLSFDAMTFVDDKVNHLDGVAPLGVRCALAAWGYNGAREHRLARERGYLVCHLEDVEQRLFGYAPARGR